MRALTDILDLRPLAIGTLATADATACGDALDTHGFAEVLAIVQWAVTGGTAANRARLEVRFQDGAAASGTGFTDITNGAVMGSMKITTTWGTAPSYPYLASTYFYERIQDGTRLRYLRPIAKLIGTSGTHINFAVSCLLGRPYDSALIQKGTIFTTTNAEFKLPQW